MLVVKKFGGNMLRNSEEVIRVAKICIEDYKKGNDVVVVLSAMGETTDELVRLAHEVNENPSKRELDMLLSTGEQVSVSLMAMALGSLGVPAISLNAFQVPMHTTNRYGNARMQRIDSERILNELDQRKMVVITGFQGIDKFENITTLGRGGSDSTAVALAAALRADACEIYVDHDGLFTADPNYVADARRLKEISYDEMLEMAALGMDGFHKRAVELAKKYGVEMMIKSMSCEEGTIVREVANMEKNPVRGVVVDKNACRIAIIGLKDEPGIAFHIFHALSKYNINVDMIVQSFGIDGMNNISFTVSADEADEAVAILEKSMPKNGDRQIIVEKNVVKISIVGAGMVSNPGIAASMFEALYDCDVNIRMISTSEIRVTVLIDEDCTEKAVNAVHRKLSLA